MLLNGFFGTAWWWCFSASVWVPSVRLEKESWTTRDRRLVMQLSQMAYSKTRLAGTACQALAQVAPPL